MQRGLVVFIIFSFLVAGMYAQKKRKNYREKKEIVSSVIKMYEDSLPKLWNRYFIKTDSLNSDSIIEKPIVWNPDYYKLFIPLTYYKAPVAEAFASDWQPEKMEEKGYSVDNLFPVNMEPFWKKRRADRRANRVLLNVYLTHPELTVYTEEQIAKKKIFRKDVVKKLPPKIRVLDLFEPEPVNTDVGEAELIVRKPDFWSFGGNGALQFTQNYISDNWYKGGESTNSLLSNLLLTANYNNLQQFEFSNTLEMKLGFITSPSDTMHSYRTNSDLLRFSTKLALKAIANWNYTLQGEFKTQFMPNYKTNTDIKVSAFMAPATVSVSLGMDYTYTKENRLNLSVLLSPLSYNFTYVGDKDVDPSDFISSGRRTLSEVGYKIGFDTEWRIISSIVWNSRLSYFSNYKSVKAEWENTFNFVLNRYLSTKLFVHVRYDDSVRPTVGNSYFQLQELLSFGINYSW